MGLGLGLGIYIEIRGYTLGLKVERVNKKGGLIDHPDLGNPN
jgi:hypothetical protein